MTEKNLIGQRDPNSSGGSSTAEPVLSKGTDREIGERAALIFYQKVTKNVTVKRLLERLAK